MYPLIEDVCNRLTQYLTNKEEEAIEGRDVSSTQRFLKRTTLQFYFTALFPIYN